MVDGIQIIPEEYFQESWTASEPLRGELANFDAIVPEISQELKGEGRGFAVDAGIKFYVNLPSISAYS